MNNKWQSNFWSLEKGLFHVFVVACYTPVESLSQSLWELYQDSSIAVTTGYSIAFLIQSVDRSLFIRLILRYQDLYGSSIAVTVRSLDPSLSVRLISVDRFQGKWLYSK